jgi:hypothetical protein
MCNCNSSPASICNQCAQGNTCGCPPDYTVMPLSVPCGCCPAGYTYVPGTTANNPATCVDSTGTITKSPIPCPSCEETISSNCVILPAGNCYSLPAGTTLTQFIEFMCSSPVFIQKILTNIGLDVNLGSAFCQLVQNCPPSGSGTTPILGAITVTFP